MIKTQNAQYCMGKIFFKITLKIKNVEKLSDFVHEINCTMFSNDQQARTSNCHKLNISITYGDATLVFLKYIINHDKYIKQPASQVDPKGLIAPTNF